MDRILAIDPGPTQSGWSLIDVRTRRSIAQGIDYNFDILDWCNDADTFTDVDDVAVEMVASYGMAVGAEVFDTCVWIGRFCEALRHKVGQEPRLVKRNPVKLHHCHNSAAKDTNIVQALVDRFAPGQPNKGKGTKAEPGWFYGFAGDIWQAYALAVYAADHLDQGAAS